MNSVSVASVDETGHGPGQARLDGGRWLLRECVGQPFSVEAAGWMVDGAGVWRFVIALGEEPRCSPPAAYARIADIMRRNPPLPWHGEEVVLELPDIIVSGPMLPQVAGLSTRGVGYAAG